MYERAACTAITNTVCGWCGSETIIRNADFKRKCVQRDIAIDTKIIEGDLENEIYDSSEFDDILKWRGQGTQKKDDPKDANSNEDILPPLPIENSKESDESNDDEIKGFEIEFNFEEASEEAEKVEKTLSDNLKREKIGIILRNNEEKDKEEDWSKDTDKNVQSAEEIVDSVREWSIVQVPIVKRKPLKEEMKKLVFEIDSDDDDNDDDDESEEERIEKLEEELIAREAEIKLQRTAEVVRILCRILIFSLPIALICCCFSHRAERRRRSHGGKCLFSNVRIVKIEPEQEAILNRASIHARIAEQREKFAQQQEKHVYVNPLMEV